MEANAPVDALADTPGKEKGETQDQTLSAMEAMSLVEPLANTLTHGGRESKPTLANVMGEITIRGSGWHGSREAGQDINRKNV